MITATDLEVRAGARTLLSAEGPALLRIQLLLLPEIASAWSGRTVPARRPRRASSPGLVSRTRAPSRAPAELGYLPQDPEEGDLEYRPGYLVLSARGLDTLLADLEKQQEFDGPGGRRRRPRQGHPPLRTARGALRAALGGHAAESEAGRICASLGLPERVLTQQLRTLSGGEAMLRRTGRGSCSPRPTPAREPIPPCCSTNPTNHRRRLAGPVARLPQDLHRRTRRHQPQRGCRPTWSTGSGSWMRCAVRPTSTT